MVIVNVVQIDVVKKCKNYWQKEPSQFVEIPERKFVDFGETEIKKRGK